MNSTYVISIAVSAEERVAARLSRVPKNIKVEGGGRGHDKYQKEETR
jgi:hypothetical protein